jgi:hypothetical protein
VCLVPPKYLLCFVHLQDKVLKAENPRKLGGVMEKVVETVETVLKGLHIGLEGITITSILREL